MQSTIASLHTSETYLMPESFERLRTLEIRRDEKTVHVLGRTMSLAERVRVLRNDALERETLNQLMRAWGSMGFEETTVDRSGKSTVCSRRGHVHSHHRKSLDCALRVGRHRSHPVRWLSRTWRHTLRDRQRE